MADIPQIVYRRTICSIWILLVFFCLMPPCLLLHDPWRLRALVSLSAIYGGLGAYLLWWTMRLRRYAAKRRYEICTCCGYALQGLPDEHICPECGEPYVLEDTRLAWQDWRSRTPDVGGKPSRKKKLRRLSNTMVILGMILALVAIGRVFWHGGQLPQNVMTPGQFRRMLEPATQPAVPEQ
jgi:predicted RNA-binding Zn-ribbon protein involved in translation (DUF1610 family)